MFKRLHVQEGSPASCGQDKQLCFALMVLGFHIFQSYLFIYFTVLWFELRAFTLSHSTSPIFAKGVLR
jgi:hypothetical protein